MSDPIFKFFPWDKGEKPHFINEEGYEWYKDLDMTNYARQGKGGLKKAMCFFIKKGEFVTRGIIDDGKLVADAQGLEDMAVKIDCLKMLNQ